MNDIEIRRQHEKSKYETLKLTKPSYGATNHGKFTYDLIHKIRPAFTADFGCGTNDFIQRLKNDGLDGVGIDFVYDQADIKAYMHDVPLKTASVDLVTSFDALEHCLEEDVPLVFQEMRRVAKPGAHFIFSICYRPSANKVNGEGLHPTVEKPMWWFNHIERIGVINHVGRYIKGRFYN